MDIEVKFENPVYLRLCDTKKVRLVIEQQNNRLVPDKMVRFKNGKILNEVLCDFGNM